MNALKVILIIIAVLLILLICPLKIYLDYDGDTKLSVGYLFLKFRILPEKPKKPVKKEPEKKEQPQKKEAEKKPGRFRQLYDKHGLDGLLELVKVIAKIVVDVLKRTAKHLIIAGWTKIHCSI